MPTSVQTASPKLHRFLTEKPVDMVKSHQWKSALYLTAAIISAIGAIAIFGGITAIYLGLLSDSSLSGLGVLGAIVAGCVFAHGVDSFSRRQINEKRSIEWYQKLGKQIECIQHWNEKDIHQFFRNHHRSIEHIRPEAMALLRQRNETHPLRSFLPLIARCQLTEAHSQEWQATAARQTQGMQRLGSLPAQSKAAVLKIYQSLEAQANEEREHYEQQTAECVGLLTNPILA
jgi:hypothetical protein